MKTVTLFAYAGPLLVAGLITLAQMLGLTWADTGLAVFVFLLHAPSFVPVKTIRQGVGTKLGAFPETPFFAFIFVAWGAAGLLLSPLDFALLAGFSFSVSVGLQFALVRVVDLIVKGTIFVGGQNPKFDPQSMIDSTKRNVFVLRVITSAISLLACWTFIAGSSVSFWWLPLVALAPVLSACSVALRGLELKALSERAAINAGATIAASVAQNPPKCAIYYSSGKSAGHKRLASAFRRLNHEGISSSIICREPHAFRACAEIKPDHLWRGYTINTLDAFTQPSIKAAIYVNEATKNPHFVRFNDRVHILLADEGALAMRKSLQGSLAIYDSILAPDAKTAAQWRRNSPSRVASRVAVIDPQAISVASAEIRQEQRCCVSLNLGAGSVSATDVHKRTEVLSAVLKWINADNKRQLVVSFDEVADETVIDEAKGIRRFLELACEAAPRISILENAGSSVHFLGDIIVATEADDLSSLAQAGKPILLFEPKTWREGVELLWGAQTEVCRVLDDASNGAFAIEGLALHRRHFTSLDDMIDAVFAEKNSTGSFQ